MKSQSVAEATVLDDRKLVASNSERPYKREQMVRQREESSTTPSMIVFLTLLAEREDRNNLFDALTIKNQSIPGLAFKAKGLREKLAKLEKADTASNTTPKGQ